MDFPPIKRFTYRNSPLVEVICQIRFPTILSIETSLPSEFQEKIRREFPIYETLEELQTSLPLFSTLLPQAFPATNATSKNHVFKSSDSQRVVNLTKNFIAFTVFNYSRWEDFSDHFNHIFSAFIDTYSPAFCSRIGLRYKDVIVRSKIGLATKHWNELIHPFVLGVNSEIPEESISSSESTNDISLAKGEVTLKLKTALVFEESSPSEKCFSIDNDFSTLNKIEISDYRNKLDELHDHANRVLRWAIKPVLHNAMNPQEI